jgi:hypothetical protein
VLPLDAVKDWGLEPELSCRVTWGKRLCLSSPDSNHPTSVAVQDDSSQSGSLGYVD